MTSHTAQPVNPALFRSRARLRATFSNAGTATRRTPLWWLAGLLPGAYALATGLHRFSQVHGARLDPDAITYLRLAAHMTPATVLTGQKEPLWPALLAIPVSVVGAHPGVIRLLGVAGFLLLVVAFQRLVALLYGRAWGIMAALLFAASPWLIYQAARGLREEASAGLVLLFAAGVIKGTHGRRLMLLAAGAAVIALLRWDSTLLTLPTLAVATIISRPGVRRAALSAAIFAMVVAPLLIMQKLTYGEPLYFANGRAAGFFRNQEFQGRPGFPTVAQVSRDAYTGERISWFEYFFHLHTPQETAGRALAGLVSLPLSVTRCAVAFPRRGWFTAPEWPTLALARDLPTLLTWLIVVSGFAGAVLLVRRRGTWPLPLMLAMSILMFAPIAKLIDPRLLMPALPFLVIGAIEAVHAGRRWRTHRRAGTGVPAEGTAQPDAPQAQPVEAPT
jgi:hypothetical protein